MMNSLVAANLAARPGKPLNEDAYYARHAPSERRVARSFSTLIGAGAWVVLLTLVLR